MAEYIAEYQTPYGYKRSRINAGSLPTPELAQELAARWVESAVINPSAVSTIRTAIMRFCKHMSSEVGFDNRTDSLKHLRRRHLNSWEASLLREQAMKQTDTTYRYAVNMFAFLRYIEDRFPGTIHPEVLDRVREPTRLRHIRREPLPDFSEDELNRIKAAVRNITWRNGSWTTNASADVLIAFQIALCISTGEPPEVIRGITLDDISASSADPRSVGMDTERIAVAGLADSYTVVLRKNRAHIVEEVTWRRNREPTTLRYLDALIRLGAPLRRAAKLHALWIMKDEWGNIIPAPWGDLSLSGWLFRHVAGVISTPHDTRRFRKSAIAAEIIAEPSRHLRTQRRHTQEMLFDHYTNSPALRLDAGERFVRSISELRDRALGPTIDTGDGVVQLDPVTGEVANVDENALRGSVAGALTGCRDPEDSPHAPQGEVCPMSRMGTCFTCPNAIITVEHLPAVVLVNAVSAPDAAVNPTTWQKVWGFIHAATATILQMFPRDAVNDARLHTDEVLVDLGLRHEMRGPTDA
ncbi:MULTISPECIES: hypothetical protein [unclassified Microbacterium]|uniref:hypothetical protein n=1 Tax=unclassified Microbacterium TaxID=2609290 RepID=UPI00109C93A1|nr:hypothetical protein [Microbacterium sp. K41]